MNSWASDLSCTDSNYCCCCLLLTPVNRMSQEKTHGRRGTWSWGVPGGGGPCVFVCDTVERGGQCLNVTTLLFAVNYGGGQGYWLCNSTEQTFSHVQWSWRGKQLAVYLFFSFLLSKMKTESTAGVEFLSKKRCQGNETIMCSAQWWSERTDFLTPFLLIF